MRMDFDKKILTSLLLFLLMLSSAVHADNYGIMSFESTLSVGNGHVLFIDRQGNLYSFGKNDFGQLGDGTFEDKLVPKKIMENVKAVYAGATHSLVIDKKNNLWAFGSNDFGELGDGSNISKSNPVKISDNVIRASAGKSFSLIIKSDYSLWSFGLNDFGQLGNGSTQNSNIPLKIMDKVFRASAGLNHSLVVSNTGSLFSFGNNSFGQLGDGSFENKTSPIHIRNGIFNIEAGGTHSLSLGFDGTVYGFGNNLYGQLGLNNLYESAVPRKIADNVLEISVGLNKSVMLKKDGTTYSFGETLTQDSVVDSAKDNSPKKLGDGNIDFSIGFNDDIYLLKHSSDLYKLGDNSRISTNLAISDRFLNRDSYSKYNSNMASQLNRKGIFKGKSTETFIPGFNSKITSVETLVMLGRVFDWKIDKNEKSGFKDVPFWADPYVAYAKNNGISNGVSKNMFGANNIDNKRIVTWILSELGENKNDVWNNTNKFAKKYNIIIPKTNLMNDLVYLLYTANNLKTEKSNTNVSLEDPSRGIFPRVETLTNEINLNDYSNKIRADYTKYKDNLYDKIIAFTFDDGPSPYTSGLLDTLKEYDSKATFFVLGSSIPGGESQLRRMLNEGHEIGNHSFTHPDLSNMTFQSVLNQIDSTDAAIKKAAGIVPKFVRPPYGAYNSLVVSALKDRNKAAILWNVDTQDWLYKDSNYVKNYILSHLDDGNIILLHDIHKTSVDGFAMALPEIRAQGYKLVTVSELLKLRGFGFVPGNVYFSGRK